MRIFFVGLAVGSCTLLMGCGDDSEPTSSADRVLPTDPTSANFSEWERRWDGERWNVALKVLDAREQDMRNSFARSFARVSESHGAFPLDAAGLMGSVQRLPSLSFSATSSRKLKASFGVGGATATGAPCDFRSCPNFAFLRLRYERFPWQRLFGPALMDTLDISNSKRRGTFQLLWDTLRGMDEVWFAEPDLAAPSADLPISKNASPARKPIFNATAPEGEPLEHIKTTRVREAEIYEKEKGYTLRDVVVAVLDTGVDRAHPRLKDKMFKLPLAKVGETPGPVILSGTAYYGDAYGIDSSWEPGQSVEVTKVSPGSTDVGGPGAACPERKANAGTACLHGTHVAGIIAASEGIEEQSKLNVRGVCRNCKILALRAADTVPGETPDNGPIREASQIRAMQFVYNLQKGDGQLYVNVLNMSIGQPTSSRGMRGVIESLASTGIVLVGAASNYNTNRLAFPAAYDGVMAVCATSIREGVAPPGIHPRGTYAKAVFSNFGEWVDICAPGQDIWSTVPGGLYKYESGTSMAAPIVAGAAGYLMGLAQNLNIQGNGGAVIKRLQRYSNWGALYGAAARNDAYQFLLPDKTGVEFLGRGFLDVANALSQAREDTRIAPPVPQIERGCIASSIGAHNPRALYDFFTGLPFVPAAFAFALLLARRLRSGLRR